MSLINQMLQELDKRHAPQIGPQSATGQQASLARHLKPVKSARVSEWFWYVMAGCMLIAVAWAGWMMWQMRPRPLVTELAFQKARPAEKAPAPIPLQSPPVAAPTPAQAPVTAAAPTPVPATAATPAPAAANAPVLAPAPAAPGSASPARAPTGRASAAPPRAQAGDESRLDMLRLSTELGARPPDKSGKTPGKAARASPANPVPEEKSVVATKPQPVPPRATASAPDSGRIDRRSNATPRERADSEYRRAVLLVNQGRVSEGMEGFRTALQIEPGHEAVRQTLVALLLEARRVDEAAVVLQEGLALNASNTAFAMLLGRILVERKEIGNALALLQKHAPSAGGNAEYHAFLGALHQRLGHHAEAIEEYQVALRIAPGTGVWWIGMGISQQALERPKEALEAYKRAKATGNLAPELVTFADQRVRLLQ